MIASRRMRALCGLLGAASFFLISLFYLIFAADFRPRISYQDILSNVSIITPGIGFDLTTSYGVAAVRYHNGSKVNIAKVSGDAAYENMMQRLSRRPKKPVCYPYRSDTFWRNLRKRFGYPASLDVGQLAKVLTRLRNETENYLGHSIFGAVTVYPQLPALCNEDIEDALEYSRLNAVNNPWKLHRQPHETSGAYAGYGLGLCTNYTDYELCKIQDKALPVENTLTILYTRTALIATLYPMTTAWLSYEPGSQVRIDLDAGLDSLPKSPGDVQDTYWDLVRLRLIELPLSGYEKVHIDRVILIGESSSNQVFLDVVRDSMSRLQSDDLPRISVYDPLYVAAQGAALFAKRAQEQDAQIKIRKVGEL